MAKRKISSTALNNSTPKRRTRSVFVEISTPPGRRRTSVTRDPETPLQSSSSAPPSPSRLVHSLPSHLHTCLNTQRRAILSKLQSPPSVDEVEVDVDVDDPTTNAIASQQLTDLLNGTVTRNEGNSCLIIGPRGSGKTRLIERCLSSLSNQPITIYLSGWVQHNDRLAMREIARQLTQQTGSTFLTEADEDELVSEEDNPFIENDISISLPPPSHLPSLISVLPTLSRPTIVILDGFDLFSLHARQSLLYCLLDTAQSCRVGQGHKGIAVVGVTSRIDTINLLEKRVKSRFSGRMIRTAPPRQLKCWIELARRILCATLEEDEEWQASWTTGVEKFLNDSAVVDRLTETFEITRDVRMLLKLLTATTLELTPSSPFPTLPMLETAIGSQRSRPRFVLLHTASYPVICLLIAAMHCQTAGHDIVTFEMLHDRFHTQVRASSSAPVQVDGGSIGMVKCPRGVLMSAFEKLVQERIFVPIAAPSTTIAKEFVRYRCIVDRSEVKRAVERRGDVVKSLQDG